MENVYQANKNVFKNVNNLHTLRYLICNKYICTSRYLDSFSYLTQFNMEISTLVTCIFIVAILNGCASQNSKKLVHVDNLRWHFLNLEENLWKFIKREDEVSNPEVHLIRKYEGFGDDIMKVLPYNLTHGLEAVNSLLPLQLLYVHLSRIYMLYERFRELQIQQTTPEKILSQKEVWTDLAKIILYNPMNTVEDLLKRIGNVDVENIYDEVKKEVEGVGCNTEQSPQQVLYHLYNTIALTELKGYIMIQFSYMFLSLHKQGDFSLNAQVARNDFKQRTTDAIDKAHNRIKDSSREIWKCDPKQHFKDETYIEVTQLLQGYVENEIVLNSKQSCKDDCDEYTYAEHYDQNNYYIHGQKRCNGRIIHCQYFDSNMRICSDDVLSGRRYKYIQYESGKILGQKNGCKRGLSEASSWTYWFWECSYCFCLCDEQGIHSDRYFNLRPMFSDIKNNMVITGLRFVKKNRIIHLQIQEGKLLPRGEIDKKTVHWVPVEDYKITDRKFYSGQDYHVLNWQKRGIDLDNLEAEDDHIMTGVRFKQIGTHLNFEIYTTKFHFDTGKLVNSVGNSKWVDNMNTRRTKVGLNHPDVPIKSPLPSVPTSTHDQYIEFINSDIDKDVAQTTVPFLDAQAVEFLRPVPLSGAGIFHKGKHGYGGFIAPKIIHYDFSKHITAYLPEDN